MATQPAGGQATEHEVRSSGHPPLSSDSKVGGGLVGSWGWGPRREPGSGQVGGKGVERLGLVEGGWVQVGGQGMGEVGPGCFSCAPQSGPRGTLGQGHFRSCLVA